MNWAGQSTAHPYGAATVKARLSDWLPQQAGVDLRGWEWYYLSFLVHRESFTSEKLEDHTRFVDFHPDEKRLAAAVYDVGFKIWNAATGRLILEKRTGLIRSLAFSPDGTRLATTGATSTVHVWQVSDGAELLQLKRKTRAGVNCVAWSPDATKLVSAGDDQAIRVWDLATQEEIATHRTAAGCVHSVDWRPGETQLASAQANGTESLWDMATGQRLSTFPGHTNEVRGVKWSPDGSRLASASLDRTVRVWDIDTADPRRRIDAEADVKCIAWSRDGGRLACWGSAQSGEIVVWEAASGARRVVHQDLWGTIGAWSPDQGQLAFGGLDRVIRVWNATTNDVTELEGETEFIASVTWNRDGNRLACVTKSGDVSIWDVDRNCKLSTISQAHDRGTVSVDWSCDSVRLATVGADATVKVWDPDTNELVWQAKRDSRAISSVRWNPDGTRLATAHDGVVVLWDGLTGWKSRRLTASKRNS